MDPTESNRVVAAGEKVVGYFSVSGEHRGELFGIPATGKTVAYDEMAIVRFARGRIVEHWSVADTLAMMQSLGAVSEPQAGAPVEAEPSLSAAEGRG